MGNVKWLVSVVVLGNGIMHVVFILLSGWEMECLYGVDTLFC